MQYGTIGRNPGSLLPKNDPKNLMKNPGKKQDYDLAEGYLLRESAMVRDLLTFFLQSPATDKAEEYWTYFVSQWKSNIINYIKAINATEVVYDKDVDHYKNHYKYRTAVRLVEEYVERARNLDKHKQRFPDVPKSRNQQLYGLERSLNEIHARLMPYLKQIKNSMDVSELTIKR